MNFAINLSCLQIFVDKRFELLAAKTSDSKKVVGRRSYFISKSPGISNNGAKEFLKILQNLEYYI